MELNRGKILTADQAKVILDAFNITSSSWIDPDAGMYVEYGGGTFWIGQGAYFIGSYTERPDGWHFVYQLSGEEIEARQDEIDQQKEDTDFDPFKSIGQNVDKVINLALLGVGAYVLVNVLGFFKKRAA